jgi:hypothetical protein
MKFSFKQSLLAVFALMILFTTQSVFANIVFIGQSETLIDCAGSEGLGIYVAADSDDPNGTLTYQWFKDGKPVKGATDEDLNFKVFDFEKSGLYKCVITETIETGQPDNPTIMNYFTSKIIPVYGLTTPEIMEQPQNLEDAVLGENYTFTFKAHYRVSVPAEVEAALYDYITWYKMVEDKKNGGLKKEALENNHKIGGANSSILTIRNLDTNDICKNGEKYFVEIITQCNDTVRSNFFKIAEKPQVVFAKDPENVESCPAQDIELTVETIKGANEVVEYLWYKDDVALVDDVKINGSTTEKLQIFDVQESDEGLYFCEINLLNDTLKVVSKEAKVVVTDFPKAEAIGETEISAVIFDDVTMKADMLGGKAPMTITWEYDGNVLREDVWNTLEDDIFLTYNIEEVDVYQSGEYILRIANDCGDVEVVYNLSVSKWDDDITSVVDAEDISFNVVNNNISFSLNEVADATITVYDLNGNIVANVFDGVANAGANSVSFDNTNLTNGVYFYTLTTDKFYSVKKVSIVK